MVLAVGTGARRDPASAPWVQEQLLHGSLDSASAFSSTSFPSTIFSQLLQRPVPGAAAPTPAPPGAAITAEGAFEGPGLPAGMSAGVWGDPKTSAAPAALSGTGATGVGNLGSTQLQQQQKQQADAAAGGAAGAGAGARQAAGGNTSAAFAGDVSTGAWGTLSGPMMFGVLDTITEESGLTSSIGGSSTAASELLSQPTLGSDIGRPNAKFSQTRSVGLEYQGVMQVALLAPMSTCATSLPVALNRC